MKSHQFNGSLEWSGNLGSGTSAYDQYGRNFEVNAPLKMFSSSNYLSVEWEQLEIE